MKKNKLKIILLIFLIPLLSYCGDVKDALQGKKRSEQSDEFLVKKKNPLQMPPDINKLPLPGEELVISNQTKDNDVKNLLRISEDNSIVDNDGSDLLNNMKKKIQ